MPASDKELEFMRLAAPIVAFAAEELPSDEANCAVELAKELGLLPREEPKPDDPEAALRPIIDTINHVKMKTGASRLGIIAGPDAALQPGTKIQGHEVLGPDDPRASEYFGAINVRMPPTVNTVLVFPLAS